MAKPVEGGKAAQLRALREARYAAQKEAQQPPPKAAPKKSKTTKSKEQQ